MSEKRMALLSVTDKTGLGELAGALASAGLDLLASGGTLDFLRKAGIQARQISDASGFPEILGGRVKTLHPAVHGGILARRDLDSDMRDLQAHSIAPIEVVVVNLYRFEATVTGVHTIDDALENIDIGGVALIRAAAKNFRHVAVLSSPEDYPDVIKELRESGAISPRTRFRLARNAFACTARYDAAVSNYLSSLDDGFVRADRFPEVLTLQFAKLSDLRYGENPHQKASFYRDSGEIPVSVAGGRLLGGKELSFTNVLDLDAAFRLVGMFSQPCAAVVKHTNPCGLAKGGSNLAETYAKARECDPVSAFGGIVGLNREVDEAAAAEIVKTFIECVIAPGYSEQALKLLGSRPNMRIIAAGSSRGSGGAGFGFDLKRVGGGLLVQMFDEPGEETAGARVVTRRRPTEQETRALDLAWKVCACVKSNAIVFALEDRITGVGCGQMSRVDSVRIAADKAGAAGRGSVMASDAFFPFRDGVDEAAKAGVTAVVQPGGSKRDEEVVGAADEHGMAMLLTGFRHFRH